MTYIVRENVPAKIVRKSTVVSANGAVDPRTPGIVFITKGTAATITLAAPTAGADDGKEITFISTTAAAHTVTNTTPGFNNAGASGDVATFGGAIGDGFRIIAYQGVWYISSVTNVTVA